MLETTISITYDPGTGSVTKAYDRYSEETNRTVYRGPADTLSADDKLAFTRRFPTKSGNFLGVAKPNAKFTLSQTVLDAEGNSIVAPIIAELGFSLPVGVTDAAVDDICGRISALVVHNEFKALLKDLEI